MKRRAIRPVADVLVLLLGLHVALTVGDLALVRRLHVVVADRVSRARRFDDLVGYANAEIVVVLVATVVTAVVFGVWIGRCRDRLVEAGRGVPDSTNVLRWGWLLPIFNLFVWPLRVLSVWRAADPDMAHGEQWRQRPRNAIGIVWWVAFVCSSILLRVATTAVDDVDSFRRALGLVVLGDVLRLVAAAAAVAYVAGVTERVDRVAAGLPVPQVAT